MRASQRLGSSLSQSSPTNPLRHIAYFDPAEGAVPNPGMGIVCYGYSDHMYARLSDYARPQRPGQALEDMFGLPYCDNVYLRIEWRDIQREPGKLSPPPEWERTLDAVHRLGKRWSFRIMPVCPQSLHERSTPDFLNARLTFTPYSMAESYCAGPRTKYYPVYNAEYLSRWRELLFLLAHKYDHDPHLEFVDVSGYGKWGEWHHWPDLGYETPEHEPATRRMIGDHLDAFTATHSVITTSPGHAEWKDAVILDAVEAGCGLRRDSFSPFYVPWEYAAATQVRRPGTAYVYEPGLFPEASTIVADGPSLTYDTIFQPLLDLGITHAGLGFNPSHAIAIHQEHSEALARLSRRIGYRIRPSIVWAKRGAASELRGLSIALVNDGNAPPAGRLTLHVRFDQGPEVSVPVETGRPVPGLMEIVDCALPDGFGDPGNGSRVRLSLSITVCRKKLPVAWAVREGTAEKKGLELVVDVPKTADGSC